MLKKRQQLESLQKAGKFKYEYDSDEDTEGGTWEHKLRKDEMVATERWAEELTEKSKDKHHIGDFLPPDELARFMEKVFKLILIIYRLSLQLLVILILVFCFKRRSRA